MLGRMLGAARLDVATYEEVESDNKATIQALIVVVVVTIASVVGQMLAGGDNFDVVNALLIGVIRGVVSWAIWALFTWIIGATILKTEADWGQLARCTGFAQTPGLLNVLSFVPAVGGLITFVAFLWTFMAMVVGVRQSLDYTSTFRAFIVILIAFIPVAIINLVIYAVTGGNVSGS